jgi:hypothetical protein
MLALAHCFQEIMIAPIKYIAGIHHSLWPYWNCPSCDSLTWFFPSLPFGMIHRCCSSNPTHPLFISLLLVEPLSLQCGILKG